ncbi:DUF6783 domain-containing protein [Enterocloster sp.]|uniref:DUF6783 domain-containing protein n=1 Tax=Enterocloster sp. TaxID=2719315 RepID=UPI0039948DFA
MKIHSRHLRAPLRGIFRPDSVSVAHYASFIRPKSPTKRNAHLTESNFQTRSGALQDNVQTDMRRMHQLAVRQLVLLCLKYEKADCLDERRN